MSRIPYQFETPVPTYFREKGWFDCEHMFKYVTWAFSKCQTVPRTLVIQGKEITLQPFEFISGRLSSPKECFLTERIFRGQQFRLQSAGILKKTSNSLSNHFSCYVFVFKWLELNEYIENVQPNVQHTSNRRPTGVHKERDKSIREERREKDHHPLTPSWANRKVIDDFSSKGERVEICSGVFLSPEELDSCIAIKGDEEKVRHAIEFIQGHPKRKSAITSWPNALATWKIENTTQTRIQDHAEYAKKLCLEFADFEDGDGWRCRPYEDTRKDQTGLLFESQSAYQEGFFLALVDGDFISKCENFIERERMRVKIS